jgi:hypothetical protein
MLEFLLHFFIGLAGSAAIFAIFFRLSAARTTSIPFGLIFFGLACGALAVYVSPWATPAALLVYAAMSLKEHLVERRDRRKGSASGSGSL